MASNLSTVANPRLKSRDIDLLIPSRDLWKLEAHLAARGFAKTSGAHLQKHGFRLLHEDTSVDVDAYDTLLGPFRVEELLPRARRRRLGEDRARVLAPTELLALKVVAARSRRGTEKGAKDLADILALLDAVGDRIAWDWVLERVGPAPTREVIRTALGDYRTASSLYPLPMPEYRRLKRSLRRRGAV